MKISPVAVVMITALMVLVPVSAVDHHENYNTAERNIDLIMYYIENILEELNSTLISIHARNVTGMEIHSANFTDMIGRAGRTLQSIPPEVDSFVELFRNLEYLNRTDLKLKNLTTDYAGIENAISVFNNFTLDFSNTTSFIENLTAVSNSLDSFDSGMAGFPSRTSELVEELDNIRTKGFLIDNQYILASDLQVLIDDLVDERMDEDVILTDVLSHPMWQWALSLDGLLVGTEPNSTLSSDVGLLDISGPRLNQDLSVPIMNAAEGLKVIDGSVWIFHSNQTRFLDIIRTLDNDEYQLNLSTETDMIDEAEILLGNMSDQLKVLNHRYIELSGYDNGSVSTRLSELSSLLDLYLDIWTNLDVRMTEFRNLARLTEELIQANILIIDPDLDRHIKLDEIGGIEWNSTSDDLVDEIITVNGEIGSDLDSISPEYRSDLEIVYKPLEMISGLVVDLTLSHGSFLENVKAIDHESSDLAPFVFNYINAFSDILNMISAYESVYPMINETENGTIPVDDHGMDELSVNIEIYRSLMEEIGMLFNRSFLAVNVNSGSVPYDSTVHITSMIFHPDTEGGIGFRDGENVTISTDWGLSLNLTTINGIARGMTIVPRNISTGDHGINGSAVISINETLYYNTSISVRRIATITAVFSERYSLDMGEEVNLTIDLTDEFGRNVSGNVTLNGEEVFVNGSAIYPFQPTIFGNNPISAVYHGNELYKHSRSDLILNVSLDPVLSISFNGSVYYLGDDINASIRLDHGRGNVSLLIDGVGIADGFMSSSDHRNVTLNSSEMGLGSFRITAYIESTVPWARSGWSLPVFILIKDRPIPPVIDDDEITEPVDDIDPPLPDGNGNGGNGGYDLKWQIGAGALLLIIFSGALIAAVIWTRRNTRRIEADAVVRPKAVRSVKKEKSSDEIPMMMKQDGTQVTRPEYVGEPVDPSRAAVISQYLDLVDEAPADLNIDRSRTPREVGSAMIGKGADRNSVDGVTGGFEKAVYSGRDPTLEEAGNFGNRIGTLRNWFRNRFDRNVEPPG